MSPTLLYPLCYVGTLPVRLLRTQHTRCAARPGAHAFHHVSVAQRVGDRQPSQFSRQPVFSNREEPASTCMSHLLLKPPASQVSSVQLWSTSRGRQEIVRPL